MLFWKATLALISSLAASSLADRTVHHNHQTLLSGDRSPTAWPAMVLVSDALTRREINIFSSLIRDDFAVARQLADASFNATVLAPPNAEMTKLPRKPWEDPQDYARLGAQAYEGADGAKRAEENLGRFVAAHVVPLSPWASGEKVPDLNGKQVWWETKDGKRVIQPDGIVVNNVADKVANGEIWVIEGVMKS